jgi:uncharacterized membrane protein YeaQ/YmgE (transglycosylase-associated protein family)
MGILAFLVFGLIAGALAQMLMPGQDPGGRGLRGIAITIGIGILGAFVGGFIGSALGLGAVTGFNLGSFALAVLGAVVFLAIWRAVTRGRKA